MGRRKKRRIRKILGILLGGCINLILLSKIGKELKINKTINILGP